MLQALSLDPTVTQKRLGDGFYEQRLIQEQIALLTGQRFVGSYVNNEEQYKGLMDAGVTYAQQWNLRPGIALTAQQMAALTSDIVWLVEQTVTLPDGSTQRVLVPQVYVRVQPGDIDGAGTLLAGREININLTGDLTNTGTIAGSVAGRTVVNLTAENVQNLGGRITGNALTVAARNDLNNLGGQIDAANSLTALAGRDANIIAGVIANSGANNGAGGYTVISAGNNLNLGVVTTASSSLQSLGEDHFLQHSQSADIGSQIQTAGNLSLIAGKDTYGACHCSACY